MTLTRRDLGLGAAFATITFAAARGQGVPAEIVAHNSPGDGSVNSWILVGPDSIAIIDGQRTMPEARAMAARVRALGRPVEAIFVTHEHPDHVCGLQALVEAFPAASLIASAATRDAIVAEKAQLVPLMQRLFGDAAPTDIPTPTTLVGDGQTIRLAGRSWRVDEHGPGEARSMTALHSSTDSLLIGSDLAGNRVTPFLLEGQTGAWIRQARAVAARYPAGTITVPGHGSPALISLLAEEQVGYLEAFRAIVRDALNSAPALDDTGRAAVVAATNARFAGWPRVAPIANLIALNADAVARELRA